jgi:ABC-type enterobactin transport system permease subunit
MVDDLTDRALDVAVSPGAVVVLTQGPVALTPMAALQSAHRLLEAADQAMAQSPESEDED